MYFISDMTTMENKKTADLDRKEYIECDQGDTQTCADIGAYCERHNETVGYICICYSTLKPATREGKCEITADSREDVFLPISEEDKKDYIECDPASEQDRWMCFDMGASCEIHNENQRKIGDLCVCAHNFRPASRKSRCESNGAGRIYNKTKGVSKEDTISHHLLNKIATININDTEHSSITKMSNESMAVVRENTPILDKMTLLQIFVPLTSIITVIIVLAIILSRRSALCKKWSKRNVNNVIKTNDDVQLLDRMNVVNKNPTYFSSIGDGELNQKFAVEEIPIEHVHILECVGEGAFGQVFKGEIYVEDEEPKQVAVKVLKEGVSHKIREDFEREVEIMSAFDHDNILKLTGVVTKNVEDSPYMIFEFMVHGDLAELLRKKDPLLRSNEDIMVLQKTDLIDISTQIANGMNYLTSQHFVHRDLATRNCLVGEGLVVKISDFGMARDIYTCDYYKIGGSRMLPVRWMSPESVKYGRFTTESDIWAYGVVLWEIFSYGRQPYYGHSNEQVVRFLDEGILLQRPNPCPSTIYHVMLGCWKCIPKERLPFSKIHRYLVEYSKEMLRIARVRTIDEVNRDT